MISVRPADLESPADLDAIAEIRIRSWQAAYAGIVPAGFLDRLTPAAEADRMRRSGRAALAGTHNLLGVDGDRAVGWACVGPYREGSDVPSPGPGAAEVYAIYLHPAVWDRGYGRTLMAAALAALADPPAVLLWVLAANTRARRFYERVGFAPDGARHPIRIAGAELPELRYRLGGP